MSKAKKHEPLYGTSFLTGYLKNRKLVDWHGKDLGWRLYDKKNIFTNEFGDKSYAVIFTDAPVKGAAKYAVGYYLGDGGDLVRLERSPDWTTSKEDKGEFDIRDLWQFASWISEYWYKLDEEDQRKLDEEREAEEENED